MLGGIVSLILGIIIFVGGAALGSIISAWCFFIMIVGFILVCFGISNLKDPIFKNDKDSTKKKVFLHIMFVFSMYALGLFVSFYIQIVTGLFMLVPLNIFLEILIMFVYDALVFSILNHMPFIRKKHFGVYIFLPTLIFTVLGMVLLYMYFPFEEFVNFKDSSSGEIMKYKISALIALFFIPYMTIIIGYLRHNVTCKNCRMSGICLMVRNDSYKTEIISTTITTTEYGKIGEVREVSSGYTVADVYGNYEKTETSSIEKRDYNYNYKCKCCGHSFDKNWTAFGVSVIRKIKDAVGGAKEVK